MKHSFLTTTAIGATLIFTGSAAIADVSAAEVWADWRKSIMMYGEDRVTIGSETMSGDTLSVTGLSMAVDDDFSRVDMDMGDIQLTEVGDGTVRVTLPESYPITVVSKENDTTIAMTVTQAGLDIVVSGDPSEMVYTMSADKYGLTVDDITEDGETLEADARMSMNNVAGTYVSRPGDLQTLVYDMTAGSIDMLFDVAPPDAPGDSFTFSGKVSDIGIKMDMTVPADMDASDPAKLFGDGLAMAGSYTMGNGAYIFDVISEGEQTAGSVSTGSGKVDFDLDGSQISYDSLTNDVAMNIQGAALPFPIEVSMTQYGGGMDFPMAKTDDPTDFGLRLNLTDLAVNDMTWMLADPSGQLPHDPATILLDLSGKAKLLFDIMDPEQAAKIDAGAQPAELHALTLNALKLAIAGAEVTGTGDFTFDNSDLTSFDGLPKPQGDVTVNIKGANALIDNLVSMGLLPEDQAMMGRMMMGMFARSTGDDELSSKIEINDQGHIIANGQRIQ